MTLVCAAVFFIAQALIVLSDKFLRMWVGNAFAENSTTLLIFHTIAFSIIAIGIVTWQMTEGLGFPKTNLYIYLLCFVVSVPTMLLLLEDFGLAGVAVGRLAGFSMLFFSIWYIEKKFFGAVQLRFWLNLSAKLAAAVIIAASIEKIISVNFTANWLSLAASAFAGGVGYVSALVLTNFFSDEEKNFFYAFLKTGKIQ